MNDLQVVFEKICGHLEEIEPLFKDNTELTFLARRTEHEDGSQDLLITKDNLDKVIRALEIRRDVANGE